MNELSNNDNRSLIDKKSQLSATKNTAKNILSDTFPYVDQNTNRSIHSTKNSKNRDNLSYRSNQSKTEFLSPRSNNC